MRLRDSKYPVPTDPKQYKKYEVRAAVERLTDGQKSMFITPAFDYRGGDHSNYGQHGMTIVFAEKRNGLVIEVSFYTGLSLDYKPTLMNGEHIGYMCTGYYYHFDKQAEAKKMSDLPYHPKECILSGGSCYGVAGSALYGETLADKLLNEGSPAIWDDIDREFKEYGR